MRERGTCEAWKCQRDAVGYRFNGTNHVNLCENHLPENRRPGDEEVVCDVCGKPNKPDATGELRCQRCDQAIEDMVAGWREDAIARGDTEEDDR